MVTDGCQSEIKALRSHVRRFCRECLAPRDVAKFRSQECFIAWVVIFDQMFFCKSVHTVSNAMALNHRLSNSIDLA